MGIRCFLLTLSVFFITLQIPSQQWVELNTGVNSRINSLSSVKSVAVWACGGNGTVIKSYDEGNSWENAGSIDIPDNIDLNHINAISDETAFITGNDAQSTFIYKTAYGGFFWELVLQQPGGKFNAIHFIDQNTGILIGDPVGGRWSIWKTINGGNTWDSAGLYLEQTDNEKGFANSLWASINSIWFGTDNYRIYRAFDLGQNWIINSTGAEKNSSSLWFDYDYNIGYSGDQIMLRTSNAGNNWYQEYVPGKGIINGVTGSAHSKLNWAIREDKIYLNPLYENYWVYDYTAPAGNYTYITIEKNGYFSGAVFATRDNGGISRTYFLSIGIELLSSEVPKHFSLSQNYPNPFNPSTNFEFSIASLGLVKLVIYDVTGREVETLLNTSLKPGTYRADWNAANYPSGVYLYRLTAGGFTETKKMLMIK
jgi:photosystem II stability/assembly factor-like uncharacterized protein